MPFFSCKKNDFTVKLTSSYAGSYKMSGSFVDGYYGNGTHTSGTITDTLIILTKYDDSTLSMGNSLFTFNQCSGCTDSRYHYNRTTYTPDNYCYLSFSKTYPDSLYINSFDGSPGGGSSINLAGIKIH